MNLLCCYDTAFRMQWDSEDEDSILLRQQRQRLQQHQQEEEDEHYHSSHVDFALKDRSALLGLADSMTCYSFGYDSDFMFADDTVDEYLDYVAVNDVDESDIEPPIRLISCQMDNDDLHPNTDKDKDKDDTWRIFTDYVPYEYSPDDDVPKILIEPLSGEERLAMNKLLMLASNTPDLASSKDSSNPFKNNGTTESNHHLHHDTKDSKLKMVEIYKDPITGRNKTRVHHIGGEKESKRSRFRQTMNPLSTLLRVRTKQQVVVAADP